MTPNTLFLTNVTLLIANPTIDRIITFLPTSIFLIVFFVIFRKLRKDGVTLKELLLDKDMQLAIKKEETARQTAMYATQASLLAKGIPAESALAAFRNNSEGSEVDPNPQPSHEQQSVSRLLAFISGLVSVGLACCITTFYIWRYVNNDTNPNFGHLVNILLTLGLGIVPYAVNKLASALK